MPIAGHFFCDRAIAVDHMETNLNFMKAISIRSLLIFSFMKQTPQIIHSSRSGLRNRLSSEYLRPNFIDCIQERIRLILSCCICRRYNSVQTQLSQNHRNSPPSANNYSPCACVPYTNCQSLHNCPLYKSSQVKSSQVI